MAVMETVVMKLVVGLVLSAVLVHMSQSELQISYLAN